MTGIKPPAPPRLLWPIVLLGITLSAFLKIAGEVTEGDTHALDLLVLQWCRLAGQAHMPIGPLWFQEGMRDLTALGSPAVLMLTSVAVWGYLMVSRRQALAWFALGSAASGWAVMLALKSLFSRARPDAAFHTTVAAGYSFPSGHAMMSAVVFLTLAALLARLAPHAWARVYVMAAAALLTGLVGVSRVYLGVHWASDVAGGWAAGAAWALLCWLVAHQLAVGRGERS